MRARLAVVASCLLLTSLIGVSPAAAADSITDFRSVDGFAISRDGSKLAVVGVLNGVTGVYAANRDGSDVRLLAQSAPGFGIGGPPDISPDGLTVVFSAFYTGFGDLYTIPIAGGTPVNLTHSPNVDKESPRYSPDGTTIVVNSASAASGYGLREIRVIDSATGAATVVRSHPSGTGAPTYSSDGSRILFLANDGLGSSQIMTIPRDGSVAPTQLTHFTNGYSAGQLDSSAAASNFGQIAFITSFGEIDTMDADGGNLATALTDTDSIGEVRWTPEGQIAYLGITFDDAGAHPHFHIPPAPTPPTSGFVQTDGTQLVVGGLPYRPIGLDIYNANSNGWCWYAMDGSILDETLTAMGPGENTIRVWFFQQLATTNGVRDWTAFDRTLATAHAHGYRVIATLVDQWGDCGVSTTPGFGYKTAAWYDTGYTQPDPAGTVSYRDWAQEVASRYADDPTVLAWQLVNEPEVGDCSVAQPEAQMTDRLRAFASDVSGAIKTADPNHLVSLGTIGSGQCGAQGDDFASVMSVPTLDLCEFHDYNPNELVPGDQWNGLQRRIDQCNALQKPLLVGELGIRPKDVGGRLTDRAKVVGDKVCSQLTAGVSGILLWNWDKDGSLLDNYDIGPADPLLATLAPWSDPGHACPASSVPSTPRQVIAAAGQESASVSWIAPASDGGSPVVSYTVTTYPSGPTTTVGSGTTTVSMPLTDGASYTFTVTAANANGPSDPSVASSLVTPSATASPPTTVAEVLPQNGIITTDPGNTGPTASAPVTAAVQVPAGGSITMAVSDATTSPPAGFSFLGQQIVIDAPDATAGAPLRITFTLDGSLVLVPLAEIKVVRTEGGQQTTLGDCTGAAGNAIPDPCVAGRASVGEDVQITVLTSSASTWDLSVDTAPPIVTVDGVSRPIIGASGSSVVGWHATENGIYQVRVGGTTCGTGTSVAGGTYASTPAQVAVSVPATALAVGSNTVRICVTDAALNTGSTTATIVKDTTAPSVTSIALTSPSPTNGSSVVWKVTFSEAVTGVGLGNFTLLRLGVGGSPAFTSVAGSGAIWTVTASSGTGDWVLQANLASRTGIVDLAGNQLANTLLGGAYQVDRVAPTITLTRPAIGASYTLGASVTAGYSCADELIGSGLASCIGTTASGLRIDTASVGSKAFGVTAVDRAGNSATKTVGYSVVYAFSGFFGSVANPPTMNTIKAGSNAPLVFSLGGNRGLAILVTGSPSSQAIDCSTHAATGGSSPAAGGLAYSSGSGRYTDTVQTSATWAGTCRRLSLVLNDGTTHVAWFRFTR